jgi:predicted ribosomally synthesized peptide with SipW-like signal peptide
LKKILFSIIAVVVCVAALGSAFAYFTDVETANTNVIAAGTLDMQIWNNTGWTNGSVSSLLNSPAGLAPGQIFITSPVYLKNVGSIPIKRVYARFSELVQTDGNHDGAASGGTNDIASKLILLAYHESNDGGATWYPEYFDARNTEDPNNANAYLAYWIGRGATSLSLDGEISLADLIVASSYGSGDYVTALCMFDGGNVPDIEPFGPGKTAAFKFEFQLKSDTTNYYQGDSASFRVDFIGAQLSNYDDPTLYESITENIGTPPAITIHP